MKSRSRWLSIALAGMLVMQSSVPVFAAEESEASATESSATEETVTTETTDESSPGDTAAVVSTGGSSAAETDASTSETSTADAEEISDAASGTENTTAATESSSESTSETTESGAESTEASTETSTGSTEAVTESTTESTEAATESSTEASTESSTEASSEADTASDEAVTEASTEEAAASDTEEASVQEDTYYYSLDGTAFTELGVTNGTAAVDLGEVELPEDFWLKQNDDVATKNTVSEYGDTIFTIGDITVTVRAAEKADEEAAEETYTYTINSGEEQTITFDADGNATIEVGEVDAYPYTVQFKCDGEVIADYAPAEDTFEATVGGHKITLKASLAEEETEPVISYTLNGETIDVTEYDADGSYTIALPEGTTFPLTITFTVDGETVDYTFETAQSTVEIAGRVFRLEMPEPTTHTLTFDDGYDADVTWFPQDADGTYVIRLYSVKDVSYPYEVTFKLDGEEIKYTFTSADDVFEEGGFRVRLEVPVIYYNLEKSREPVYASDMEGNTYSIWLGTDPFFPFEVQFTYNGQKQNEWFDTPDDTIEIGGYTFKASEYFTGEVVTQMSLEVGGQTIVVRPEEKEFTEEQSAGVALFSTVYYPISEVQLDTVDLTKVSPVELTQVKISSLFEGRDEVSDSQEIAYRMKDSADDDNDYITGKIGDTIDLSLMESDSNGSLYSTHTWEFIVGTLDQLDSSNIRYTIPIKTVNPAYWMSSTVCADTSNVRSELETNGETYVQDGKHYWLLDADTDDYSVGDTRLYLTNTFSTEYKCSTNVRVYKGYYTDAQTAMSQGEDITSQIIGADMSTPGSGYDITDSENRQVTFVSFDSSGNITGCLPLIYRVSISELQESGPIIDFFTPSTYDAERGGYKTASYDLEKTVADNITYMTYKIYREYSPSAKITWGFHVFNPYWVDAAYVGNYDTIDAAEAAGATDISWQLTNWWWAHNIDEAELYEAVFENGVTFSVFIKSESDPRPVVYKYCVKAVQGTEYAYSDQTDLTFTGLKDADGNDVKCWNTSSDDDSYADGNFVTYFVDKDTDLTKLAPTFIANYSQKVYKAGSSTPIESGTDFENFANGNKVQYTCSSADGVTAKNYWVQVLKAVDGQQLFVTSLQDPDAETTITDGVVYSKRAMMFDSLHESTHDIFVANIGTETIPNLKVELQDSTTLELDSFLTLKGTYDLEGFTALATTDDDVFGETRASNFATVRLKVRADAESGSDVDGKLVFSSNGKTLMVLTLTGTLGDPQIVTKDIPEAVKYVPYGTMIQNNNKYSGNTVAYSLQSGTLPEGVTLKSNGEIYGVPQETGDFTFTVKMDNSMSKFADSYREFTLTVLDNTDENVDNATDEGYTLLERIGDNVGDDQDQTLRSEGVLGEYKAVYLDGQKLTENVDYVATSGSTRITVRKQTLQTAEEGKHTISVEFRKSASSSSENQEEGDLKKAAQNFTIHHVESSDDSSSESSTSEDSTSESSTSENSSSEDSTSESSTSENSSSESSSSENSKSENSKSENSSSESSTSENSSTGSSTGSNSSSSSSSSGSSSSSSSSTSSASASTAATTATTVSDVTTPAETETTPADTTTTTPAVEETVTDPRITTPVSYTIQSGDSLRKIAKRYYGNSSYWENIFEENQDVISNANLIYPGQVISLPPIDLGNGSYLVPTKEGGELVTTTQDAATDTTTAPESTPAETTYTVKSGDSLMKLAKKFYGDRNQWRKIYNANRDKIQDPNLIYPGQQLTIPQ